MLQESKDIIRKHFVALMKQCDLNFLKELMVNNGVFSTKEINDIFLTSDERHNKRVFFFELQKKEQRAFEILIKCLKETNQHKIAELLSPSYTTCKPFCLASPPTQVLEATSIHESPSQSHIGIRSLRSNQFYDTTAYNGRLDFYASRSRKRGKLLIINNYDYKDTHFRPMAVSDQEKLQKLFTQMGGWNINLYENKTAGEMKTLVIQFAQNPNNKEYDICFVIIMGYGGEESNQTVIYGVDGSYMFITAIESQFTNDKCEGFRGKPKVLLFQPCRRHIQNPNIGRTETDSVQLHVPQPKRSINIRTQEDMLIGYPILYGSQGHSEQIVSQYINIICETFMMYAHVYPVDDLLQLVNQDSTKGISDERTVETTEYCNKGFKKLYLHPGIYYEDGEVKYFSS